MKEITTGKEILSREEIMEMLKIGRVRFINFFRLEN